MPDAAQGDINDLVLAGEPATPDELEAAIGIRELPLTEVTADALMSFNQPEVRAVGVPGGGGVSTAADLALYYQALLADPIGIWKPEVLADVDRPRAQPPCPTTWARPRTVRSGLVLAGDDGRSDAAGMGQHRLAARVRAQRRGRPDRVGRPRHRPLVLLPHERARPAPAPAVAPHDRHREPGRELRQLRRMNLHRAYHL